MNEEGGANNLCYDTTSLNRNQKAYSLAMFLLFRLEVLRTSRIFAIRFSDFVRWSAFTVLGYRRIHGMWMGGCHWPPSFDNKEQTFING